MSLQETGWLPYDPDMRTYLALAATAVLVLAGCGAEPEKAPLDAPIPFVTHHVDKDAGMPAAEVRGTLVLPDGCLMVDLEGDVYPLVLPDVATWDEQAQEVTIDGRTFAVGDEVSWGGAYGPPTNVVGTCPVSGEVATVYFIS